jgi:hypothetical protein
MDVVGCGEWKREEMKKVQDFIKDDSALIEAPSALLLRSDNLICSF